MKRTDRRKFLRNSALFAAGAMFSNDVVYAQHLPAGVELLGMDRSSLILSEKHPDMIVLNDRPINMETPAHLLNDGLTPNNLFFVRNNGIAPANIDVTNWSIDISGESAKQKKTYTIADLKSRFENVSYDITLECGGNGRKEFNPPAKGNQWGTGAVGCARWTGVRLKDVLKDVGVKSNAVYIGYHGADIHLSGAPDKDSISRGVPISKAMEAESLIAWRMNGQDIPILNGHPLRLVFGGYPASCSGKWLQKIVIRDRVHDGQKMMGTSYRVPCDPVAPGTKVPDEDMCIIERMPVKSLITYPKTGATIKLNQKLPCNGHAWTSADKIMSVEYSIDFGVTWKACNLTSPANKYAWQHFDAEIAFPKTGYYEIWAKATDSDGKSQPMLLPGWNPKGYLNNACHRIAIKVV